MLDLKILLLASFVGLSGLGLSAMMLQRSYERQQRFHQRMARVVDPHQSFRVAVKPLLLRVSGAEAGAQLRLKAAALFGFHPDRQDHYPLRWWLVLPLALVLARLLVMLAATLFGALSFVLILPAWLFLCRGFFAWAERRRVDTLFRQFPDALAMIVRSVRVGIPVGEAIRLVAREAPAPTAGEFTVLADQIAIGMLLDEALRQMGERNNLPEYRFFGTALSLQSQTGGGLAETLENLADVIRKRVAMKERGHALASEAKTSAGILAALPVFSAAALAVLNPSYIAVLFTDPGGRRLLGIAIGMLGGGIMIMRTMIRRSLS